ncbi:hypothetical protein TrRE_jg7247, partial [Triparma retinervis]
NLALLGASRVVLGCRTKSKCEYAKLMIDAEVESLCFPTGGFVSNVVDPSLSLDLSSLASIKAWSDSVTSSLPYVSHLALNAGVMSVPLNPRNPSTGVEPQLHTNHVAHHYLTVLSMSAEEGAMMSVRALVDEGVGGGCYVTPMAWAVGPPVVSCPRERRGWEGGEGRVKYPFLGTAMGAIWGGWEWKKEDVERLEEWTVGITGSEIK